MYKWVQNTFALSEEGSRTFVRGVVWTFLHFISLMFPMMMLFYFLMEQMGVGEFAGRLRTEPYSTWESRQSCLS